MMLPFNFISLCPVIMILRNMSILKHKTIAIVLHLNHAVCSYKSNRPFPVISILELLIFIPPIFQVALAIVELFKPGKNTSLGVLALMCSPREGASNALLLLAEGDLTFTAALTAVNNFATLGK